MRREKIDQLILQGIESARLRCTVTFPNEIVQAAGDLIERELKKEAHEQVIDAEQAVKQFFERCAANLANDIAVAIAAAAAAKPRTEDEIAIQRLIDEERLHGTI